MSARGLAATVSTWSWTEICRAYPNQWVCLLDIDRGSDRLIRSARVIGSDPSMERAIEQIEPPDVDMTVVHTSRTA